MMKKVGHTTLRFISMFFSMITNIIYRWERIETTNVSKYAEYNEEITIDVYRPRLAKTGRRLTIIHPILTGDNVVARVIANWFAIVHVRPCAIVHRGAYPFEATSPEEFEKQMVAYFYNYKLAEGVLEDEKLLRGLTEVMSIGTSMGGFVNAYLAAGISGVDYDRYVSIMAGDSIIRTMETSSMDRFQEWYEHRRLEHGYPRRKISDYYLENMNHDLSHFLHSIASDRFFTILARYDTIVPYERQKKLRNKANARSSWTLPCGHATIILFTPVVFLLLSWWTLTNTRKY